MRAIGIGVALALAAAGCGGGGGAAGTSGGGGGGGGPKACALDVDCSPQICEGGYCTPAATGGFYPNLVHAGPRNLGDVGVHEALWFQFDEPLRLGPGGFTLREIYGTRTFDATAELSADRMTLILHPIGVTAPTQVWPNLAHATSLSGYRVMDSPTVTYGPWWPVSQDLSGAHSPGSGSSAIAVDGADGVIAAWVTAPAGGISTVHASRWDGAAWSDLGVVNVDPTQPADAPALAAQGSAVAVAFREQDATGWRVVVRTWTAAGGWSSPLGGTVDASSVVGELALAFDAGGRPVVAHTRLGATGQGQQVVVHRWDGAAWRSLGAAGLNLVPAHDAYEPHLAVDAAGGLVASFRETLAIGSDDLEVETWDGASWSLAGGAPAASMGSDGHGLAIAPDGRVAVAYLDGVGALNVAFEDVAGWTAPEVISPGGARVWSPTLLAGPGGLWAGYGWGGACYGYLRGASGWTAMGPTEDPYSSSYYRCGGGPMAASATAGPFVVFGNAGAVYTGDVCVYGLNR